ncbi:GNAT family N-acetyltransferase [Salipiger abyssi]|uniref:GNAT family N-acetyltransferase n=1 Tax=Salipiger abyssi TaxID=1250539 RepID=UPI001A90C4BE|nr:GNAT family N-acetyltransferase [Salipiger abyssi]MBN9887554.1 GNAT family N-acetyltransferase [Salipiger abyssi]
MSPRLRPATPTDAGRLGAMIGAAVASRPWKPRLHSGAEDIAHAGQMIERGWVTVAEVPGSAPLGFLARDGAYVHALFVAPEAQGAGIGRALIEHAKARSPRLDLWTFAANEGAQRFYERAGFAVIERGDGSRNDEGLPDIRYQWQAKAPAPQESAR